MTGPNVTSSMSLRCELDNSPVQIDVPAGPWPAGPTENDKVLGVVDLVAGEGSIFQRRFHMGGKYLVRMRQGDFKLPDAVENRPPTYDRRMDADHPADSPLSPPPPIRRRFPDFASCKASRCSDKYRFVYHANGDLVEEGELAECHGHGLLELRAILHPLPCGHLLCSACLSLVAEDAISLAHSDNPVVQSSICEAAVELGRLRHELVPRQLVRQRAMQKARIDRVRGELLQELGLSCCGQNMHLAVDWILCLDESVARSLWFIDWWLFRGQGEDGVVMCGWSDCRAALSVVCLEEPEE